METALYKELLRILALADILHKNNQCRRTWGGLSSACTKLEWLGIKVANTRDKCRGRAAKMGEGHDFLCGGKGTVTFFSAVTKGWS